MNFWGWNWPEYRQQLTGRSWARNISSLLYLSLLVSVLFASVVLMKWPKTAAVTQKDKIASEEVVRQRRLLLQASDKIVRYQKYYRELYGRYTGDIGSLGIPDRLVGGNFSEVHHHYELHIELRQGERFFLRARGRPILRRTQDQMRDVFRIDQDFSIHSNFPQPQLSREFLVRQADRVLQLREKGENAIVGIAQRYWIFSKEKINSGEEVWIANGVRGRVRGGQRGTNRSVVAYSSRPGNSLFSKITSQLRLGAIKSINVEDRQPADIVSREITLQGIYRFLEEARYAQHVYFREKGHYALTWQELDQNVGLNLIKQGNSFSNIDLEPVELARDDFRLRVRGTAGDILGEVFTMDRHGNVEQVRFTDVIVERLRATTEFLANPDRFQISEVPDENAPIIQDLRRRKRAPAEVYTPE